MFAAGDRDGSNARAANSYDFVRFCAASAVLFSHHFDLSGFPEPQVPGFGEDFGEVAVEVFFCLSGFLICRSLQKSTGWTRFAARNRASSSSAEKRSPKSSPRSGRIEVK